MDGPTGTGRGARAAARLEARLPDTTEQRLRWGVVALAAFGVGGLFTELVLHRHWSNGLQLIAWLAVGTVALAVVVVIRSRSARTVMAGRVLALAGIAFGGLGVFIHIRANYEAAPLDYRFTDSWPSTPEVVRWALAATDTVGPAPTLVPGAIAFMALALLLGTIAHPALRRVTAADAVTAPEAPRGGAITSGATGAMASAPSGAVAGSGATAGPTAVSGLASTAGALSGSPAGSGSAARVRADEAS